MLGNPLNGNAKAFAGKILQKLYPEAAGEQTDISFTTSFSEEHFSKIEIDNILKRFPRSKAPGFDGIDSVIVWNIHSNFPELLATFMNKCLDLKKFPTPFKTGLIVLFHKKGREKNSITSYRPISLLPILGKLLEKLLLQRVSFTINKQNVLHPYQFGFREGKSSTHALRKLSDVIEDAKKREHYVIVISLDIQGTLDNLKYGIIRKELRKLFTKSNISETLEDILSNLKVAIQTSDGPAVWKETQGCPQGSCNSPLFWNVVADEILKTDWAKEIHLQAFADDFAFVISGRTRRELKLHTSITLESFKNWTDKNQFDISLEESQYLLIGKLSKGPVVRWRSQPIKRTTSLKYLGVILDEKLNWFSHIQEQGAKAVSQYQHLCRIAGPRWGLKQKYKRILYQTVTERMLLYGASAWALSFSPKLEKKLSSIQRIFLLYITCSYRTTPTAALQTITGIIPLHLKAQQEAIFINVTCLRK
ncbi:Putative protein in type-1 retrotransposable element R1DM [Araneus ventricosus]|uniref:Reverse transcriptase domain-containing protein n=1 Tax=Araneus ventricosus TaxID=182803 RepID=A0A4Y2NF41_ARAVE|nr:Putative protein in type-1 retrotransposable element R1DM [Araneus ventricosus]